MFLTVDTGVFFLCFVSVCFLRYILSSPLFFLVYYMLAVVSLAISWLDLDKWAGLIIFELHI
uniref:Uncharacterized protein n=1 Tax=Arundo donax TaxID=35708 RepID=A0A0A9I100_ARUDO